jgi:hypothetical protein
MVPAIGIIIGMYVLTRMAQILTTEPEPDGMVRGLAIATVFASILGVLVLVVAGL